ncbi:uncharacterized protein [Aegilops tauschii subsp. strangulata]|uniref:DUF4220 domain-containing protein n=1 Tax=Aegilops tauschii subsp. strangulata TaxID=200361 RepID=A0A453DMV1_AEGTS|nr:uncharacterized protein LOC123497478 [Aegilops tauschii subsp. strangulata]
MTAESEPLVVFWSGRGIHITVLLSFTVQVTLFLLTDIRRRADWPVLKVVIWSAYMLADMTAIYALGHLSVVVRSPEHHLMALWAPLLLVHLGGQDSITAYAIEDNRLWLRHLQTFGVQVLAAAYVLYASSVLFHSSLLRSAAILIFVVGFLKYGERVWALMGADRFASSSLSATSYKDFGTTSQPDEVDKEDLSAVPKARMLVIAYSLLDIPKQMFEGPTHYVKIENARQYDGNFMLGVVEMQLRMMYDLLYTKAAVVHTWYGFFVRVISLPFTIAAALLLFHALRDQDGYRRADVFVTKVLLIGAVVLETMSVLRAVFSTWMAALLYERKWYKLGRMVQAVEFVFVTKPMMVLVQRKGYWSDHMRQHDLFKVFHHTGHSIGSKIAKKMGREDLWDSTFYSWSTRASEDIVDKVLELVSTTTKGDQIDITGSRGRNALKRHNHSLGVDLEWSVGSKPEERLDLDESILVWHIATHVYLMWYSEKLHPGPISVPHETQTSKRILGLPKATKAVCNYMFFLLAARSYMLPYPVTRQGYIQLCHDSINHHLRGFYVYELLEAILDQKDALMERSPLEPNRARDIIGVSPNRRSAQPLVNSTGTQASAQRSINTTLDRGCQLAAKLIHTAETDTGAVGILEMIFEVWVEMLCYTAYWCNEKSHAKNLTNGGELMTTVALMMVYMSNGFIKIKKRGEDSSSSV